MSRKPKGIVILTEAGQKNGFGHLVRCKSLQQAFQASGVESQIIVNGNRSECQWASNDDIVFANWLEDDLNTNPSIQNSKLVVIDSYKAPANIYDYLAEFKNLACIDDNNRLSYPISAIIINGSIFGDTFTFPQKKTLLGPQYALLRKEFWDIPTKLINKTVDSILITFGGGDLRGLTRQVLLFLTTHFPNLKKTVVITKAFPEFEIINGSGDEQTTFLNSPSAEELLKAMLSCDLAISSGGQTIYELIRVGVPTIAITEIENQVLNVKHWTQRNVICFAGVWNDKDLLSRLADLLIAMQDPKERTLYGALGKNIIDGRGSLRVVEQLRKFVKL